jgi:hypothetical protein
LARSERLIEGLNNDEWYVNRYDRTHTLNVVGQYTLSAKWSFGANFAYITGVPYSIPSQKYIYEGIAYPQTLPGTRGNIRVPDYHRLDFSATKKNKKKLLHAGIDSSNPSKHFSFTFSDYYKSIYFINHPFNGGETLENGHNKPITSSTFTGILIVQSLSPPPRLRY